MSLRIGIFGVLLLVACTKKPAVEVPDAGPALAQNVPPQAIGEMNLFERLALEEKSKGRGDPSVQKVFDALTKAGLTVASQQPHLGAPIGAVYCLNVHTAEHVTLGICEYTDAKAAEAGAEVSRVAFKTVENRTVHVHRATTLTATQVPADQISAEALKKALAAFEAL